MQRSKRLKTKYIYIYIYAPKQQFSPHYKRGCQPLQTEKKKKKKRNEVEEELKLFATSFNYLQKYYPNHRICTLKGLP